MFYAPEILRRGGRFYLCWVADSWPTRFASVTRRQLQSANIVQLCIDLQEVIATESGTPMCRFSLRLSTRLLHGLLIVYERKVHIMLNDLCMFDANILKFTKTRWEPPHEERVRPAGSSGRAARGGAARAEEGEAAQQEAEAIEPEREAMANLVANIGDITLQEQEIVARPLPVDNFGEENPEDLLRQLESMRRDTAPEDGRGSLWLDPEPSRILDRTAAPSHVTAVTLAVVHHSPYMQDEPSTRLNEDNITNVDIPSFQVHTPEPACLPQPVEEMELEELTEAPPAAPRHTRHTRHRRRLILDKTLIIDSKTIRECIDNSSIETVEMVLPVTRWEVQMDKEELAKRPARGWHGAATASPALLRLYTRNLAPLPVDPRATRDLEAPETRQKSRKSSRIEGPPPKRSTIEPQHPLNPEQTLPEDIMLPQESLLPQQLPLPTDLVLQKDSMLPKDTMLQQDFVLPQERGSPETMVGLHQQPYEAEKENVDPDIEKKSKEKRASEEGENEPMRKRRRTETSVAAKQSASNGATSLHGTLHAAGLADPSPPAPAPAASPAETPLGSLDRTKVSLGDSIDSTESSSFMKAHWCPQATLLKIITLVKKQVGPVTVAALLQHGPVLPGKKRMAAAHCFTSILKLKHAGFLKVIKNPITLEIADIDFGPKFARR